MEVFGLFGFIFAVVAFMMAGFAVAESSQLRKEVQALSKRLPDQPPTV